MGQVIKVANEIIELVDDVFGIKLVLQSLRVRIGGLGINRLAVGRMPLSRWVRRIFR